jgi:hypothetical protein
MRRRLPTGNAALVAAVAVAGSVGVALRLRELLSRRSLWLDEAMLANNIVRRDWWALAEPLDDNQGAPVGFLWAQRSMIELFGNNEYALRAVPFVAGVAVLGLTYLLARRLLPAWASAVAVLLVALCPPLVRYSTEVKQYSLDVAVALLVSWLALRALDEAGAGGGSRRLAAWAAAATAAVWLSHYALFVVAGTGAVLLAASGGRRRIQAAAAAGLAAASFGAVYLLSLRDLRGNDVLVDYWAAGFPPDGASPAGAASWLAGRLGGLYQATAGFRPAVVAGGLSVAGVAVLARRGARRDLAVLLAPVAVLVVAAVVHVFPMTGRLVLAVVPVLVIATVAATTSRLRPAAVAGAVAVVVLVGGWAGPAADVARSPTTIAEIRPVLEVVAERARPGDHLYVHDVTEPPARYYGALLGLRPERRLVWEPTGPACADGRERSAVAPPGGSTRAWVVYAYRLSVRPADEAAMVFRRLDGLGRRATTITRPGAAAALYDFGRPATSAPLPPGTGELSCLGSVPLG